MSRDDGVILLKTKGATDDQYEYRVAHTQAIECLWNRDFVPYQELIEPSEVVTPTMNHYHAVRIFFASPVFTDLPAALMAAYELYQQVLESLGAPEYGICPINDFSDIVFPDYAQAVLKS